VQEVWAANYCQHQPSSLRATAERSKPRDLTDPCARANTNYTEKSKNRHITLRRRPIEENHRQKDQRYRRESESSRLGIGKLALAANSECGQLQPNQVSVNPTCPNGKLDKHKTNVIRVGKSDVARSHVTAKITSEFCREFHALTQASIVATEHLF